MAHIIIIGAGLVGTSLACALSHSDIQITFLEKSPLNVHADPLLDTRPISLAYGSQQYLQNFDVWDELQIIACPIETVHVSNKGSFGATRFQAADEELPALGYVVPMSYLQRALFKKMLTKGNVEVIKMNQLEAIHYPTAESVQVTYDHGNKITADCLVVADGSDSDACKLLHIQHESEDHQQRALLARISLNQLHQQIAYERFSAPGVLAVLPLWEKNQCGVVWTLPSQQAEKMQSLSDEEFKKTLQQALGYRLGKITSAQRSGSFPLMTKIAKQQIQQQTVIIGNAARTIYPVAAQGFNLALRDVMALAQCFLDAQQQQQNLGSSTVLERYVRLREKDQQHMLEFVTKTERYFAKKFPKCAKGAVLLGLDLITPLKHQLALKLTGLFA